MKDREEVRIDVLKALFAAEPCPDSTEVGRACRYCESEAVMKVLEQHGLVEAES